MKNRHWFIPFFLLFPLVVNAQTDAWKTLNQNAKHHLIQLINIDTAQPEARELPAARYIYKELNKHKIDWDIFIPSKGHANLLARIKGTDPTQKPLLLVAHLDTAPAADGWKFSPFKATVTDGKIYGLGATDAKNYLAVYLALFTWLKHQPQAPKRDIIFLATSGEENGSETGLLWLGGTHWDKIDPAYALNEGGGLIEDKNGPTLVFVESADKMYMDIKITAHGETAHSSMPVENNAVFMLSQALAKIAAYNPPARLTPTARTFFQAIYPLQTEDGKTTLDLLLSDNEQHSREAAELMSQDPFFRTQLKDTFNPTELSSGKDPSITSAEASALLNVRLLPDADPDAFLEELTQLFKDEPQISLEMVERPHTPAAPAMDGTDPLFAAISQTAQKLWPGAITATGLNPASGDSELLRKWGVITYGLGPAMNPQTPHTPHTPDEFITEKDLYNQLRFLAGVVFNFAYGEDLLPIVDQTTSATIYTGEKTHEKETD